MARSDVGLCDDMAELAELGLVQGVTSFEQAVVVVVYDGRGGCACSGGWT